MKTRWIEERIGEYGGPVDWQHPMLIALHQTSWGKRTLEMLRELDLRPDAWLATTDGGSPKFGFAQVLRVGMWDGWPYWTPTPSFQLLGTFGAEWHWPIN